MNKITKTKREKVKMVDLNKKPTRTYHQYIEGFGKLGKEIKISPKANVVLNSAGFKTDFFVPTININVGIGNHHTMDVVMTVEAWKALQSGEPVTFTTEKEFKNKYL